VLVIMSTRTRGTRMWWRVLSLGIHRDARDLFQNHSDMLFPIDSRAWDTQVFLVTLVLCDECLVHNA
jgi:hypothetical protein